MLIDEKTPSRYSTDKDFIPDVYSAQIFSQMAIPSTPSFPTTWTIEKTKKGLLKSTLSIANSQGILLNAVSTHSMHTGITIHSTSNQDSSPLITAKTHFKNFHVQMPSRGIDFKTKTHWWKTLPRVEWEMVTKQGVQHFEWASSYGSWKLRRRGGGFGGEEVVARWNCSFTSTRLSGEFEFLGLGASGQLGETFRYVAAAIALAIGKLTRDASAANAGAFASAYAGSGAS